MLKFIIVRNCKNILGETASSREGLIPRGFMLKKKRKRKKRWRSLFNRFINLFTALLGEV